jgi:citrate/tricarballylate utilization protein
MSATESLEDARHFLEICNACRYCEGFCAVFPAMELRREFTDGDIGYLANLCHNCRGCYYSCQFSPPHEFNLNLPRVLAEVRNDTYAEHAWPAGFGRAFADNGVIVSLVLAGSIALVLILAMVLQSGASLYGAHLVRPGAFYEVIPFGVMSTIGVLTFGYALVALGMGARNFWRQTGQSADVLRDTRSIREALHDVLTLKYLGGGGHGCNERDESYSMTRRWLHHAMFYGFLLCFAATAVATVYHHVFGLLAPYGLGSLPVLLGTVGGVSLMVGCIGSFSMKLVADQTATARSLLGGDVALLMQLVLIALSGLVLLAFRSTGAMGVLLAIHLGIVLSFFLTMPYGKFVHGVYRSAALLKFAKEHSPAAQRT